MDIESDMYKQKSTWSSYSVICTIVILALFIGIILYSISTDHENTFITYLLLVTLIAMCVPALCFLPISVQVDKDSLNIAFSLRNKTIPLSEIARAEPYYDTRSLIRTFGSGGFFGWWGLFCNKELGHVMVYATGLKHLFLIELKNGRKYLVSCSDPEALCDIIHSNKS